MAKYNPQQIADILRKAGWDEKNIATAVAVAMAESSGNSSAKNKSSSATGLFQIMASVWLKDPDVRKIVGSQADLYDPVKNAKAALIVLQKQGWDAWEVYNKGTYKKYLDTSLGSAGGGGGGAVPSAAEQAQNYGYAYSFLRSDKELWALFQKAVKEGYTPDKFGMELKNTAWYKKNSESARQFTYLKSTDPATFNARMAQTIAQLRDAAQAMGAVMSDAQIKRVAEHSLMFNWNDSQLRDTLSSYVRSVNGVFAGDSGDVFQDVSQAAWRNGIKLTGATIQKFVQGVAAGTYTVDEVKRNIRNQAKSLAPGYAAEIDAGMDLYDITASYRESMGQLLELNPADVDLFDPTIRKALNTKGADGKPASMTLTDFETMLRQDKRWLKTKNAQDASMAVANQVLKDFGFKGN